MENLKCNNPDSEFFGQNIKLYAEEDYTNEKGELVTRKGDLMCSDTIRRWYDVPHYIFCLNDVINQAKLVWKELRMAVLQIGICIVWRKLTCCVLK